MEDSKRPKKVEEDDMSQQVTSLRVVLSMSLRVLARELEGYAEWER